MVVMVGRVAQAARQRHQQAISDTAAEMVRPAAARRLEVVVAGPLA
jgi:hypothetical protein